jgi:hypothetical protein
LLLVPPVKHLPTLTFRCKLTLKESDLLDKAFGILTVGIKEPRATQFRTQKMCRWVSERWRAREMKVSATQWVIIDALDSSLGVYL